MRTHRSSVYLLPVSSTIGLPSMQIMSWRREKSCRVWLHLGTNSPGRQATVSNAKSLRRDLSGLAGFIERHSFRREDPVLRARRLIAFLVGTTSQGNLGSFTILNNPSLAWPCPHVYTPRTPR